MKNIYQKTSTNVWENYYKKSEVNNKWLGNQYPNEELIKFISNQRKSSTDKKLYFQDSGNDYSIKNNFNGNALEIGFGGLANLLMLKEKGYNCYGLEISKTSVKIANKYIKNNKVKNINLKVWDPEEKITLNKKFKIIVGLQCIYYNLKLPKLIDNFYDHLETDGQFIFSFFSRRHEYNKYTKVVDKKKNFVKWSDKHPNERIRGATLYQPKTSNELKKLFFKFKNVRVFLTESNQLPIFQSWWYVTGKK